MSFKKDASGNWLKTFYVKDDLGSTRKVVKLNQDYQNYVWTGGTWLSWRDGVPTSPSDDANFAPYNETAQDQLHFSPLVAGQGKGQRKRLRPTPSCEEL